MGRAKEIIVKVIPAKIANEFVKKYHYSGKFCNTSNLHFGCFLDGKLHGVLSFGSPIQKKPMLKLVENTGWNQMLELNRMAFDDYLPKYSESRCIAISIKLIKKNAPQIKWVLSFADGCQCGDGAIYRASGFKLTKIKKNNHLGILPNGEVKTDLFFTNSPHKNKGGKASTPKEWIPLDGYQLQYIYIIDKSCKITVPILPFSKIDEMGAGMYKGEKITIEKRKQNASIA